MRATTIVKLGLAGLVALLVLVMGVSSCTTIEPGHVGVKVNKLGSHRGVDSLPLGAGLVFLNPFTESIHEYPTYMQTLVLTDKDGEGSPLNDAINVNSVEGQPLSLDVSMSFELDPRHVPGLYSTFRTDITQITHSYVKQTIRQALQEVLGNEEIASVIGPKKAEATGRVTALLTTRLEPYGIIVKQFTINELRAPGSVMQAINQKNVMQQQALTAQNELQKSQFESQRDSIQAGGRAKAILAEARAQAQANELLTQSITSNLVQYELAKRWNGQMPQVTGGGTPLLQLPASK